MQKHNQYNINFDGYRFYPNVFLFKSEVGGSFVKVGAKLGDMFSEAKLCGVCKTITTLTAELIPMSAAISGPINRRWGYLFGGAPDARTLAHELGHGRFTLRHTFSSELCGGDPGHTANHNLMDYGFGTGLNRFQWEAIHNPALIGKVFQDDEDGALKGENYYEEVVHVIEKIRCAYATNRVATFDNELKLRGAVEVSPYENFNGLLDGVTYPEIRVELKKDITALTIPLDFTFVNDGKWAVFNFGDLIIKVSLLYGEELELYMKSTFISYAEQQKEFIDQISENWGNGNIERSKVIRILRLASQCMFEGLSNDQRLALIAIINNHDKQTFSDEIQRVVVDIIRTVSSGEKYFLEELINRKYFAKLEGSVSDVVGENRYTEFCMELLKLYDKAYPGRLSNVFYVDDWGRVFLQVTVENLSFGQIEIVDENDTPFYSWPVGCSIPSWTWADIGKIYINANETCGYYNGAKMYIDPLQPVVMNFEEGLDLKFFKLSTYTDERMIAMPAFMMNWFRSKAKRQAGVELLTSAITTYISAQTLGGSGLVAKGVPKALLVTWNSLVKFDAAFKLLLTIDQFEAKISTYGEVGNGQTQGQIFLSEYRKYSDLFGYVGKPTIELLLSHNIDDLISSFLNIGVAWDVIKNSDVVKTLDDKEIEDITSVLIEINSNLNSNVVK